MPEVGRPVGRTLPATGRVELSSGTGLYWARADLFVTDHPYFTVTDGEGRFRFDHVPAGAVDVVVWLPGWEIAHQERNPDTTAISEMSYTQPIERAACAVVTRGAAREVDVSVP